MGPRTGARRRGSGLPAQDAPTACSEVWSAVDGWHGGTGGWNELAALAVTAEVLVTTGAVMMALDARSRAAVTATWYTSWVSTLRWVARVVRAWTQWALCPAVTPSQPHAISRRNLTVSHVYYSLVVRRPNSNTQEHGND